MISYAKSLSGAEAHAIADPMHFRLRYRLEYVGTYVGNEY